MYHCKGSESAAFGKQADTCNCLTDLRSHRATARPHRAPEAINGRVEVFDMAVIFRVAAVCLVVQRVLRKNQSLINKTEMTFFILGFETCFGWGPPSPILLGSVSKIHLKSRFWRRFENTPNRATAIMRGLLTIREDEDEDATETMLPVLYSLPLFLRALGDKALLSPERNDGGATVITSSARLPRLRRRMGSEVAAEGRARGVPARGDDCMLQRQHGERVLHASKVIVGLTRAMSCYAGIHP